LVANANQSLENAKKQAPVKDLKLSDDIYCEKIYQFAIGDAFDDSKLPKQTKKLLKIQSQRLADKLIQESKDQLDFTFMSSQGVTEDPNIIEQDMKESGKKYNKSARVVAGATNITSTVANDTQRNYYSNPQVLNEVESFTFMNSDPVSAICQKLVGTTVAADDYAALSEIQPPLHHNCKSWLRANLKTTKGTPEITGMPTITKKERESITLGECCK
jgi:hypothetical protein